MKLISCKVTSFGALKDFEYEFADGLNTIKQDNGWGKSTFANFIKAMFYGLADGKHSIAENERSKYKPWNSTERFGGSLVFEWADKQYKIERFFGNKSAEDSVRLFDYSTGVEYKNTENLGERVFGVNAEGFLSTAYCSQKDFEIKSNSSITAKYNEIYGQDDVKFDKAVNKLETRLKEYKSRGDKGLINEIKREIFAVNERMARAKTAGETAAKLKEETLILQDELQKLKDRDVALRERAEIAGRAEAAALKHANYERAKKEHSALLAKIDESEQILQGVKVDDNTINSLKACIDDLELTKAKRAAAKEDLERLTAAAIEQPAPKKQKNVTAIVAAVLCALFAVTGVVLAFFIIAVGLVLVGLSLVLLVATTVLFAKSNKAKPRDNDGYSTLIEEKRARIQEYVLIEQKYESTLQNFFHTGVEGGYYAALERIRQAVEERGRAQEQINRLEKEISEMEKDKDVTSPVKGVGDLNEINREISTVSEWYSQKNNTLAQKMSTLREYEREADELTDLENTRSQLIQKGEEYAAEYEIIEKTLKFLYAADENLKTRYREPLARSLNKYLSMIDGGKTKVGIDIDLKITVEGGGASRDTDYFSKGYRNLFDICKRFALADIIFTKERPFMILDDPFCNLDDHKLEATVQLLRQLKNEYQILYLVCHESRQA